MIAPNTAHKKASNTRMRLLSRVDSVGCIQSDGRPVYPIAARERREETPGAAYPPGGGADLRRVIASPSALVASLRSSAKK